MMSALSDPFKGAVPFVKGQDMKAVGAGIYVWTDGNLEFIAMDGSLIGPYAVTAGQLVPFRAKQITNNTTATVTVGKGI